MTSTAARAPERRTHDGLILALACAGQFMVVLDVSIVNVALPSIQRSLGYDAIGLQWVVNAYVLTFAGFLLLGGRAADLFGRRRVYIAGVVLFTAASLVGGLAPSAGVLTAARAVQGIGGAIMSPATLTIILTSFAGPRLPKALGAWSAVAGAGGAAGSLLGGVLTQWMSWRWVLFINVPVGVVLVLLSLRYLHELRGADTHRKLDVPGAVLVTVGLSTVVYAIVNTDRYGWLSARTAIVGSIGLGLLGLFARYEQRATHPLIPFRIFRSRSLSSANAVMMLVSAAFFAMWFFLTLYFQQVLGYSALRAGLAFAPQALAIIFGAQLSSRLIARMPTRPVILAGTTAGTVGFVLLAQLTPAGGYWAHVFPGAMLIALALGLLFTPLAGTATHGVEQRDAGLASGVLNAARQVGGSLGLAALVTIAYNHAVAADGPQPGPVALVDGYVLAFWISAGILALATAATLAVPRDVRTGH